MTLPDLRARMLLAMALATSPGLVARAAGSEAPGAADEPPKVVRGSVARLAPDALALDTPEGTISLTLDRNTTVFLEERVGTLQDLRPGTAVRADLGPGRRASWIEVEPRLAPPVRTRHASAGPIVLPAPAPGAPAAGVGPGTIGEAEGTAGAGVDVPAGPDVPEPNPGAGRTAPASPPARGAPPAGG